MSREAEQLTLEIERLIYKAKGKMEDEELAEIGIPTIEQIDENGKEFLQFMKNVFFSSKEAYKANMHWISKTDWHKDLKALHDNCLHLITSLLTRLRHYHEKVWHDEIDEQLSWKRLEAFIDRLRIEGVIVPYRSHETIIFEESVIAVQEGIHSFWEEGYSKDYFISLEKELLEFAKSIRLDIPLKKDPAQ